jgi:hypothetical protein
MKQSKPNDLTATQPSFDQGKGNNTTHSTPSGCSDTTAKRAKLFIEKPSVMPLPYGRSTCIAQFKIGTWPIDNAIPSKQVQHYPQQDLRTSAPETRDDSNCSEPTYPSHINSGSSSGADDSTVHEPHTHINSGSSF